jgi:hypothetical protein
LFFPYLYSFLPINYPEQLAFKSLKRLKWVTTTTKNEIFSVLFVIIFIEFFGLAVML